MTGLLVSSSELPMDLGAVLWLLQKAHRQPEFYILLIGSSLKLESCGVQGACRRCASKWPRQPRRDSQRRPNSPVALGSPTENRRSRGTPVLRLIENFRLAKAPTTEAIALDMLNSCGCCCVTRVVVGRDFGDSGRRQSGKNIDVSAQWNSHGGPVCRACFAETGAEQESHCCGPRAEKDS